MAGCATNSQFASDPLLDSKPLPRQSPPAPTTPIKKTSLPPMPAPSSSTSPAALATGAVQPLDPRPEARTVGRGNPAPNWKGQGAPGSATLQAPQPMDDSAAHSDRGAPAAGFMLASAGRPLSYEQAQAMLTAYGVTWQRLEAGPEPGEWKFSCSIPNRQNPQIRRFHEARAGDPLAAVRAVLEQIEKERN